MTKEQWLSSFVNSLIELENESYTKTDAEWTKFMVKVMKGVGEKTNCRVISRDSDEKQYSGEYLNIDAMFIDKPAYNNWNSEFWDPPVLPSAVVELENNYDFDKITYCLWKILCIRSKIRVLICYQNNKVKIESLKRKIEDTIRNRDLMKNIEGDLLVVIGDDSKENAVWKDYFKIFNWQNEVLENIVW